MDEEGGNRRLVLAASCLGFFVAILRATSVNTALPAIRDDLGLRVPLVAGLAIASLGSLFLVLAGEGAPYVLLLPNLLLVGFGGGLRLPPATAAVVSSAPAERAGIASAVVNSSRRASGVLGVALLGALAAGGSNNSFVAGLHLAGLVCAGVFLAAMVLSLAYVRGPQKEAKSEA